MYLNFFQSQISNVFKAFQRESLDVFEMFNVRVKMSLDLVQCKSLDVFKLLPPVLKSIYCQGKSVFKCLSTSEFRSL